MANFYSDELISEVIAANDIVDIASGYMKLQRSGNGYKGLCPFHSEKTPSFHISADKQLYHCFGCGVGGSSLQFIMNIENLDFVEALKFLADRAKISLPEENSEENNNEFYEKRQAI
ncbi:MAG: DNA primase, partial [Clostridia bacterium]|nr:DNA primase [Clostridia bacterium]